MKRLVSCFWLLGCEHPLLTGHPQDLGQTTVESLRDRLGRAIAEPLAQSGSRRDFVSASSFVAGTLMSHQPKRLN
jgi:hypothetical protein